MVSGSGSGTSELLGLVPPGIRDEQRAVVGDQDVLDLLLGGLIDILLVVGDERLGDGLTDRWRGVGRAPKELEGGGSGPMGSLSCYII